MLLAALSLSTGYQLSVPRSAVLVQRAPAPMAQFGGLFGGDKKSDVKDQQLEAMKEQQELRRDPVAYEIQKNKRRNMERATAAAKQGNIPPAWGSAVDGDGDRYFYDAETKEGATYDPPPEMIAEMMTVLEDQQRKVFQDAIDRVNAEDA